MCSYEVNRLFDFQLVIYDNDHPAVCSSINDPHITTFDGRLVFSVITDAVADADERCLIFCRRTW